MSLKNKAFQSATAQKSPTKRREEPKALDPASGNIQLYYWTRGWGPGGNKEYIGSLNLATLMVARDGYTVPYATVEETTGYWFEPSNWTQWFQEHHVDTTSPSYVNLMLQEGGFQYTSTHNDFASARRQIQ